MGALVLGETNATPRCASCQLVNNIRLGFKVPFVFVLVSLLFVFSKSNTLPLRADTTVRGHKRSVWSGFLQVLVVVRRRLDGDRRAPLPPGVLHQDKVHRCAALPAPPPATLAWLAPHTARTRFV